ncbi:MAG: hypothetical protein ACKOWN_02130, partial [Microbacteriaceae bacterium]
MGRSPEMFTVLLAGFALQQIHRVHWYDVIVDVVGRVHRFSPYAPPKPKPLRGAAATGSAASVAAA